MLSGHEREGGGGGGEKKKEEKKIQNFSLRSTEFRRSEFVGTRMKVHLLDEGYAWVLKGFW